MEGSSFSGWIDGEENLCWPQLLEVNDTGFSMSDLLGGEDLKEW